MCWADAAASWMLCQCSCQSCLLLFAPEKRLSKADDGGFFQANDSGQLMSTSGFFSY